MIPSFVELTSKCNLPNPKGSHQRMSAFHVENMATGQKTVLGEEGSTIDGTFDAVIMDHQEGALTTDRHPATMIPTWIDVEVTHQAETTMATSTEVEAQEGLPQGILASMKVIRAMRATAVAGETNMSLSHVLQSLPS